MLSSVGSDTRVEHYGDLNKFNIDLNDEIFSWIDQLSRCKSLTLVEYLAVNLVAIEAFLVKQR